jgi:hypothetical protein
MNYKLLFLYLIITLFFHQEASPCSIFYAKNDSCILTGNNEDYHYLNTRIIINPPGQDKFGSIIFSFENLFPQGGLNDQGLFFDWATINGGTAYDPNFHVKGTVNYNGRIIQKMIESCATVDDVIRLFKTYNDCDFGQAHMLVGDKYGNSVVIERSEEDSLNFIRMSLNYQIATNFLNAYLSDSKLSALLQNDRYQYLEAQLKSSPELSIPLFREILQHARNKGNDSPTLYSYICNITSGKIYVYNYSNFEEALVLTMDEEMMKSYHVLKIPELYSGLKGKFPLTNVQVNSNEVTFEFFGNADKYEIWIDESDNFKKPRIETFGTTISQASFGWHMSIFAILFLISFVTYKKKLLLFTIILASFFAACEREKIELPDTISNKLHSITVSDLVKGKKYYWKIIAVNSNGYNTESKVYSFYLSN